MSDLARRIAGLSPEKRRLLELMLADADPAPAIERDEPDATASTDARNKLAEIWQTVLGLPSVREDDNFFELGGDSIQAIQIVAKARREGIEISTNDLFANPTVNGLLTRAAASPLAPQGPVYGAAPLTPIQHWFFDRALEQPQHWNQSVLLESARPLDLPALEQALLALYRHHDALRLRFEPHGAGWRQEIMPVDAPPLLSEYPVEQLDRVRAVLESGFDLSHPPLFHAALFRGAEDRPALLLFVIHHLLTDGVSLRVLLEDLALGYSQALAGSAPVLPPKTASLIEWSRALHDYAQTPAAQAETEYWLGQLPAGAFPLPVDNPGGENSEASAAAITREVVAEETARLTRETASVLRASLHELLLAALAAALRDWTGSPSILIEVEGHGRESTRIGLDVSRTAGWFTSLFPMRLDLPVSRDPAAVLTAAKQAVRSVPGHGLGYGLLRYVAAGSPLRALRIAPPVLFNYLGHFQTVQVSGLHLRPVFSPDAPLYGPRNLRPHLLQVMTSVVDGRLRLEWIYSRALHRPETMERLADAFIAALRGFADLPASGGAAMLASDFPDADLDHGDIQALFGAGS
jgi:non-ribosomal peptide synthase protein (TIGR01720 family)